MVMSIGTGSSPLGSYEFRGWVNQEDKQFPKIVRGGGRREWVTAEVKISHYK